MKESVITASLVVRMTLLVTVNAIRNVRMKLVDMIKKIVQAAHQAVMRL
jgi:hypothetical protein